MVVAGALCSYVLARPLWSTSSVDSAALAVRLAATGGWASDVRVEELLVGIASKPHFCDFRVENATSTSFEASDEPALIRGGLEDAASFFEAWSVSAMVSRKEHTQVGGGTDVVYAGGGQTNHATFQSLVAALRACRLDSKDPDDVFAFDSISPSLLPRLRTPFEKALSFLPGDPTAILSVGPSRSGLPAHSHGPTWLAVAHGAKRWFVSRPGEPLGLLADQQQNQLHPLLSARAVYELGAYADAMTCLQLPGDIVYLPAGFKHATLNVAETVAVGLQASSPVDARLRAAKRVLRRSPQDLMALHDLGVASAHKAFEEPKNSASFFEAAVAALTKAAALNPLQPEVHLLLGEVLAAARTNDHEAIAVVQNIRRRYLDDERNNTKHSRENFYPNDLALAATYRKFARFFLGIERYSLALEPLSDALRLRPHYAAALKDRAIALEHLRQTHAAIHDLHAASAIDPDDPDIQNLLSRLQRSNRP